MNEELANPNWSVTPSSKVVDTVERTYQQFRAEGARQKLSLIEKELSAAFSEFNARRALLATDEWNKYAEIASLTKQDELFQRVQAVFEWLNEEAEDEQKKLEYDRTLAALENALDRDSLTKTELSRLFNNVERFDEKVPDRVVRRYTERLRTIEEHDKRRGRLVLVASLSGILVLGVLVAVIVLWRIRSGQIENAREQLAGLLDEGRITEAQSLFDKLGKETPFITEATAIKPLVVELSEKLKSEESRKQRVRQHIDAARTFAESPSTWPGLQKASNELARAEEIALHEHELVSIKTAQGEVDREQNRLQDEVDANFVSDVTELLKQESDLVVFDARKMGRLLERAEKLKQRVRVTRTVKDTVGGIGIDQIGARIQDRIESQEKLSAEQRALDQVVRSIGGVSNYRLALESYVKLPNTGQRGRDFESVLNDELTAIAEIGKWNALVTRWNQLSFSRITELKAKGATIVDEIETSYSEFPEATEAIGFKKYLVSLQGRGDGNQSVLRKLAQMFQGETFMLNCVTERDGSRLHLHYFLGRPKVDNRGVTILAFVNSTDNNETDEKGFLFAKVVKVGDKTYAPAPQSKLAKFCTESVLNKNEESFEQQICDLLSTTLDAAEVDPIFKFVLLKTILDQGKLGSSVLAEELAEFEKTLKFVGDVLPAGEEVNWYATRDTTVEQFRILMRSRLDRIVDHPKDVYKTRINPRLQTMAENKVPLPSLTWVGILLKDPDGERWTCKLMSDKTKQSGDLLVRPIASDGKFITVGSLSAGKAQLRATEPRNMIEGRPVWLGQLPDSSDE